MATASTSSSTHESQTISLADWGPDVTGRTLGIEVRESIESRVPQVIFDCSNVETMSPSFADEVFGKLAAQEQRPHVTVVNASPDVLDTIRFAVSQRTSA